MTYVNIQKVESSEVTHALDSIADAVYGLEAELADAKDSLDKARDRISDLEDVELELRGEISELKSEKAERVRVIREARDELNRAKELAEQLRAELICAGMSDRERDAAELELELHRGGP